MKKLRLALLIVFMFALISVTQAQSKVEKTVNENYEFTLKALINNEIVEFYLVGVEQIKITPVGNLLRIVTAKVPMDNEIMELAIPFAFFSVTAKGDFDGDGEDDVLKDNFAVLTKTGNLKFVYHRN